MKKLQILLVAMCCSLISMAQPPQGKGRKDFDPAQRAKQTVEQLSKKMEINEKESTELEAVFTNQMTAMKEKFESGERPSREEMEALRNESNKEVKAILGDERFAQYEAMMKERMQNRKSRRRPRESSESSNSDWR